MQTTADNSVPRASDISTTQLLHLRLRGKPQKYRQKHCPSQRSWKSLKVSEKCQGRFTHDTMQLPKQDLNSASTNIDADVEGEISQGD